MITITGKKINSTNTLVFDKTQTYQFAFCKFENVVFDHFSSPYFEFIGCFFDNITFKNAVVQEVNFLACLGHEGDRSIKIIDSKVPRMQAMYSNIDLFHHGAIEKWQYGEQKFTPIIRQILKITNQERIRYECLRELEKSSMNPKSAIPLVCVMLDSEWEIRRPGLQALSELYQNGFPIAHDLAINFLLTFLGDQSPLVMYQTQDFIRDHHLNEQRVVEALKNDIEGIFSSEKEKVLEGIKILLNILTTHSLDKKTVIDLAIPLDKFITKVKDSDQDLKLKFYELLDKFDDPRFNDIIIYGFQSSSEEIRIESLKLVSLLTTPPDLKAYAFLLKDTQETVRAEAFCAAYVNGDFQETIVQKHLKVETSKLVLKEIQQFQES